jgi:uncharacterized protein (TIGR02246 family)
MPRELFHCVRIGLNVLLVVAGGLLPSARAAADRADAEAAILQAGKDYVAALARGDAKALADSWTKAGTFTDVTGRTVKVHDLLTSGALDKNEHPQANVLNSAIRFVTDDVAIEDGDCETATSGGPPAKAHFEAIWVKQQGRWKLDSLHETPAAPATNHTDDLASLDVFVGQWSGEAEKSTMRITAKWDANKKFLRRELSITSGTASLAGIQIIGWDPASQDIKSWTFLDDGSYAEGIWSREGNVWMVLTSRALPDSKMSSATQIYKFPDKNTMVWKSIRGSVDGQATDDFEVTLKRAAVASK